MPTGRLSRITDRPACSSRGGGHSPVRTPPLVTRSVMFFAVPLLLAGAVSGVAALAVATVRTGASRLTASVGSGALKGVAATSASNAWAVGSTGTGKAPLKRWNGRTSAHRL